MLKAIAFGLSVGAAIQAFRAFPASLPLSADSVAVLFILGIFAAFIGGRARRGSSAYASATAVASAESTSNAVASQSVNLIFPAGMGAGSQSGVRMPSDHAPWLDGANDRPALDASTLEGMDLSELIEQHPEHAD